jgi:hypothetical protein
MPKPAETHVLYLRKFPKDLSQRLKIEAAIRGCTIPHTLALILREYFKLAKSA